MHIFPESPALSRAFTQMRYSRKPQEAEAGALARSCFQEPTFVRTLNAFSKSSP